MRYTDDPVSDASAYFDELERKIEELPLCIECGEPIQDEHCYFVNDEYICEDCMNRNHRIWTEDVIE